MTAIAGRFVSIATVYVGAIAPLVERVVRNDEVGGSNPPGSTLPLRLRVAQPPSSRKRSVPGIARKATPHLYIHPLFSARGAPTLRQSRSVPGIARRATTG